MAFTKGHGGNPYHDAKGKFSTGHGSTPGDLGIRAARNDDHIRTAKQVIRNLGHKKAIGKQLGAPAQRGRAMDAKADRWFSKKFGDGTGR